jgi:arginase
VRSRIVVLDAPSNLGLRPPVEAAVPGCYKLPWALRDAGLLPRLGASDGGAVVPGRYDRAGWAPGAGVFNAAAIAGFSDRLAARVGRYVAAGEFLVVLGGDCSILLGAALGLRRLGRYGLAYIDGHSDFRHPGNAPAVGAAAGEDLALVTGRGQSDLVDIEGRAPYVRDADTVVFGIREGDQAAAELAELRIESWPAARIRQAGAAAAVTKALARLEAPHLDGFWVHLDADVLDPEVLPAVDSPEPGGLLPAELTALLSALLASPYCVGLEVTVFDPDLDPDGRQAALLTDILVGAVLRLPEQY